MGNVLEIKGALPLHQSGICWSFCHSTQFHVNLDRLLFCRQINALLTLLLSSNFEIFRTIWRQFSDSEISDGRQIIENQFWGNGRKWAANKPQLDLSKRWWYSEAPPKLRAIPLVADCWTFLSPINVYMSANWNRTTGAWSVHILHNTYCYKSNKQLFWV